MHHFLCIFLTQWLNICYAILCHSPEFFRNGGVAIIARRYVFFFYFLLKVLFFH